MLAVKACVFHGRVSADWQTRSSEHEPLYRETYGTRWIFSVFGAVRIISQNDLPDTKTTMKTQQSIRISDCTLRDARYAPGIFLSTDVCLTIAKRLGQIGVDEIEIGKVSSGKKEKALMAAVNDLGLNTSCIYFCLNSRTIEDAIHYIADIGCRTVCISIPSSDPFRDHKLKRSFRAACKLMEKAVAFAVRKGLRAVFSGEDASRADARQLKTYIAAGFEAGASRFRFAESVACLNPFSIRRRVGFLTKSSPIDVEIHCHNAYGLAVANALAAMEAGARWVSVTIGGIGERGGNTPLEPILLYLYQFCQHHHFQLKGLKPLADYVSYHAGLPLHRFTPIVGDHAFQYELGNQFQASRIYEHYPPDLVGNHRHLAIGRHCDLHGMRIMLAQLDNLPQDGNLGELYDRIKKYVAERQTALDSVELKRFIEARRDGAEIASSAVAAPLKDFPPTRPGGAHVSKSTL